MRCIVHDARREALPVSKSLPEPADPKTEIADPKTEIADPKTEIL